jgi:hypothetical protein
MKRGHLMPNGYLMPLVIGDARIIIEAIRAASASLYRQELDDLHRRADLVRAEVREMRNLSRSSAPSNVHVPSSSQSVD